MAVNITENGDLRISVRVTAEVTADQVLDIVTMFCINHPEAGAGKFDRKSGNWFKKQDVINLVLTFMEEEGNKPEDAAEFLNDAESWTVAEARKRAKNLLVRAVPDLAMALS